MLPVYLCFFLIVEPDRFRKLDHLFPFLKPRTREDVVYLIQEFIDILVAFFRGQLVIAFLQGALFAIGFQVAGLRYGLVLGLMLGFLNIIPYLGSIVGLAVALPIAYWQEGGGIQLVIWGRRGLRARSAHRGVRADAAHHGRPHRPAPDGDHRRRLLLGLGAQRHRRHDPGDPADGFSGRLLAAGPGALHRRGGVVLSYSNTRRPRGRSAGQLL